MNYQNLFKIAIRAIAANKMRSFLTALGIIIGIAAVITMLAIGQGSKASIKANIAEMGSNMIMISPGADMRGGVRQDASSMETLKQADYQSIKEDCNYISAISHRKQFGTVDLRQQQYAEFHLWREPGLPEHPPVEGGRWRNVY